MKSLRSTLLCIAFAAVIPVSASAATRYVRPGAAGNNSGTDWTNAYTSLPATLVRGDTYYLADGSYGGYTFDDAESGTQTITLRKAIESDHGTGTGWSSAYGDGRADFGQATIIRDNYVFDGQRRDANWTFGSVSNYGIRFKGNGGKVIRLDNGSGQGGDNLTFLYVDVEGNGRDTGQNDDAVYGLTGNSNIIFRHSALHDVDRVIFLTRGNWRNLTVDSCYMARNENNPTDHSELLSATSATDMVFINNVIEDIEGTAIWAGLNDGTWDGAVFAGNTIRHTATYNREGISAVIFVANDSSQTNFANNVKFYNNTMVNLKGVWSGVHIQAGSNNESKNNIWYNSTRLGSAGVTHGYNWYYNTQQDGDSSATKVVCTSGCNKFVSLDARDYRLTTALPGTALTMSENADMDGTARGADGVWDRGAYEYGGATSGGPPLPPTLLPGTP